MRLLSAGASAFLLVSTAAAQQEPAPSAGQAADSTQQTEAPQQSPPGPVGGVEQYRLEGAGLGRSYYVPRLSVGELYNSNPGYAQTNGASQSDAVTTITGGISLQWLKPSSTLTLDYSSEGLIYDQGTVDNGVIQQLGVKEKIAARRWTILFAENFSYLPSSAFLLGGLGYTGGGYPGLPGIGGGTSLGSTLPPTQTIAAPNVSQLSSTSAFQAQYDLGAGSSLSGSATVGFLHFFGSSLLDSRDVAGQFGYDKALTRRDTLSFNYTYSRYDYTSGIPGFSSQTIQVGFRRILTGRLHLSVLAGPLIARFSPPAGQTTVPGGSTLVSWSLNSILDYRTRRGSLSLAYNHGTSGGSGYFVGTFTDQVTAALTRTFGRAWSGSVTGGFARNTTLQQTTPGLATTPNQVFNTWFGGANLSRTLGRYSSLSFNYNASRQTGTTTMCVNGLACGPIALIQTAGLVLNWSTRPLKFE
jgi:hypothetical protein